jgi:hypothetical protein
LFVGTLADLRGLRSAHYNEGDGFVWSTNGKEKASNEESVAYRFRWHALQTGVRVPTLNVSSAVDFTNCSRQLRICASSSMEPTCSKTKGSQIGRLSPRSVLRSVEIFHELANTRDSISRVCGDKSARDRPSDRDDDEDV